MLAISTGPSVLVKKVNRQKGARQSQHVHCSLQVPAQILYPTNQQRRRPLSTRVETSRLNGNLHGTFMVVYGCLEYNTAVPGAMFIFVLFFSLFLRYVSSALLLHSLPSAFIYLSLWLLLPRLCGCSNIAVSHTTSSSCTPVFFF